MLQDLQKNIAFLSTKSPRLFRFIIIFATVRYQAVYLYRLSSHVGRANGFFGHMIKQINQVLTGADIAWQAQIGNGLVLFHPSGVVIGADVVIGSGCEMQQGVTIGASGRKTHKESDSPILGRNVRIGAGARVLGGIKIGNNVSIGANAVVIRDVADDSTAVGVPASVRPKGP